ncbi:MAG: DNA mismatch repair endonuclease MutL [Oscillospiraceae bacterium]
MASINLLKKEVYELIAAGEVIDRPASVIKELLENAVDAGATTITVEIKNGGRTFMRVTDNGCGIPIEEVPTAFLRHATSKVSEKADLENIMTLGFRGEALASICAVAKVEMLTKTKGAELGAHFSIAGGEQKCCETAGCPEGTSIMIRDLFFNVPARLKFLKKDATEANRIQELMSRLAVSHPEISIKLIRDNKPVIVTAGDGKLYSAIYSVFGREFANSLLPVNYEKEGVKIYGYISKPLTSKTNRKFQVFYVNGRFVRSEVCSQALEEAYRNSIMVGKFPTCVLKLEVSPDMTDVNVHPAKTEIRFSDNRFIYDSVYFAVKQALTEKDRPTQLKLDSRKFYDEKSLYVKPSEPEPEQLVFTRPEAHKAQPQLDPMIDAYAAVQNGSIAVGESKNEQEQKGDLFLNSLDKPQLWDGMLQPVGKIESKDEPQEDNGMDDESFEQLCSEYGEENADKPKEIAEAEDIKDEETADPFENTLENFTFVSKEDFIKKPQPTVAFEKDIKTEEKPVVIGELFKTYIVAQCGDDMLLIDKHAAHERFIFEKIKNDSRNLSSQTLLEPIMVMLSFDEYDALSANVEKAEQLGFIIEPDVAPAVAVHGLPMILRDENPTDIITEIAQKILAYERDPAPDLYDELYHSMACKAAIKAHDDTKAEELQSLVDSIYGREDIRYCPHGRPVMITMPRREIEKQFKRIV